MGDEHGKQKHSHSMLAVMLNVTNPLAATLQATHVILAKDAHSFAPDDDGRSKTRPRDIKISGATWIGHLMGRPADPIVLLLVRGIDQVRGFCCCAQEDSLFVLLSFHGSVLVSSFCCMSPVDNVVPPQYAAPRNLSTV